MPPRQSHLWSSWASIPTNKRRSRLWFWARVAWEKRVSDGKIINLLLNINLIDYPHLAMVVRFITRRFIGEYDPNLEKIYTCQTTLDKEQIQFDILDATGHLQVGLKYSF